MKRLTAKDYKKKFDDLSLEHKSLETKLTSRLIELAKMYPNAYPLQKANLELEPTSLGEQILEMELRNNLRSRPLPVKLSYLEAIEKWLEEQHPHKQLKINF
jgi:hypothetical protein